MRFSQIFLRTPIQTKKISFSRILARHVLLIDQLSIWMRQKYRIFWVCIIQTGIKSHWGKLETMQQLQKCQSWSVKHNTTVSCN